MRYNTIPFFILVPAATELYLVSSFFQAPFKISRVKVRFRSGSNDLMLVRLYEATSPDIPTTGEPSGINLFAGYISDGQFRGDNIIYDMLHEIRFTEGRRCFKVYANNTSVNLDYMSVLMTIVRNV